MMRWPDPGGMVRRAGFLGRRPGAGTRGPPRAPGLERLLVAVGAPGAFAGFADEARRIGRDDRMLAAAFAAGPRFHVLPGAGLDILLFPPTNLGGFNRAHVFPYLGEAFGRVALRAWHAVLVEYGSSPDLPAPLVLVRAVGEPVPGAPALALALAGRRDPVGAPPCPGLVDGAGALGNGFLRSTVLVALPDGPCEARRALARVAREFAARRARLDLAPGDVPEECLVLDLGAGVARNDRGDEVGLAPPRAALAR